MLILHIGSIVTLLFWFASQVRFDWLEDCVSDGVAGLARAVLCRSRIHGLDRSSDVSRVVSHLYTWSKMLHEE